MVNLSHSIVLQMEYINDSVVNVSDELLTLECTTPDNIVSYAQERTKQWITGILDGYSVDYSVFTTNWESVCSRIASATGRLCRPMKIITVNDITFQGVDPGSVFLQKLCDRLTEYGYCIRRATEIVPCTTCHRLALPCEELYNRIVSSGHEVSISLPLQWQDHCISCSAE